MCGFKLQNPGPCSAAVGTKCVGEVAPAGSRTYLHENPRQESALGPPLKAVLRVGSVA